MASQTLTLPVINLSLRDHDPELSSYNLPELLVLPLLSMLRGWNTAADILFYDVGILWTRLITRGFLLTVSSPRNLSVVEEQNGAEARRVIGEYILNLGAHLNPEGSLLVIDAVERPFIRRFANVDEMLTALPELSDSKSADRHPIHTVCITGVGSSALGAAAFAWNVSDALRQPVIALVPGYGLADILPQALGGWFGFGLHDYLEWIRKVSEELLHGFTPELAIVGRKVSARSQASLASQYFNKNESDFRTGSPESDILHDILLRAPAIDHLCGHSKGALCIKNAIKKIPTQRTDSLHVTTLGCAIQEETNADYNQIMGRIDLLGQMNSWGNWPRTWVDSWHTTNTLLPLPMHVSSAIASASEQEKSAAIVANQRTQIEMLQAILDRL